MAKSAPTRHGDNNPHRPNFWGMMRDVLVTSLNKGQFLIGMGGFIIIIGLLKMPSSDVSKVFFETISLFKVSYMYGWISTTIVVPTSVYFYNRARKLHKKETDRLKRLIDNK